MARAVTRIGIASRFNTNPNTVPNQEFVPGPSIPPAALSTPQSTQPLTPNTPTSLYVGQKATEQIATPNGPITVQFTAVAKNGIVSLTPSAITKNVIFSLPIQSSNVGIGGSVKYTYSLAGANIIPTPISGNVTYNANLNLYNQANANYQAAKSGMAQLEQAKQQYITALNKPNMPASYYQSYRMALNSLMEGNFNNGFTELGYYENMEQSSQAALDRYAPTTIATVKNGNFILTGNAPEQYIYGNVGGKRQYLGALQEKPVLNGNSISFQPGNFTSAIVTISGQGYYAGIPTTYNATTGQIGINPSNYAYVTGNAQTARMANGEIITALKMPQGFGLSKQFPATDLSYLGVQNIPIGKEATESYSSKTGYELTNPGGYPSSMTQVTSLGYGLTQITTSNRTFNPQTGALSYVSATGLQIPGVGYESLPFSFSVKYSYGGNQYAVSEQQGTLSIQGFKEITTYTQVPAILTPAQGIAYANTAAMLGTNQYYAQKTTAAYASLLAKNFAGQSAIRQAKNPYDITQTALSMDLNGYPSPQGPSALKTGVAVTAMGEPAVITLALAPVGAAIGLGASVGVGELASYVTTGKAMNLQGTLWAADTGAISGGILQGIGIAASAPSIARFVAVQTGKSIVINAGLGAAVSTAEGLANPSLFLSTTSATGSIAQSATQQIAPGKSRSLPNQSSSKPLFSNFANPQYINFIGQGTAQSATYGAEFAGEFEGISVAFKGITAVAPSIVGRLAENPIVARPLTSFALGATTYELARAQGANQRTALVAAGVMASVPLLGSVSDLFSTRPQGTPTEEGSLLVSMRSNMDATAKGAIISVEETPNRLILSENDVTDTEESVTFKTDIQQARYGSVEYTAKYPTIRYKNAIVETQGIGISRTLTGEETPSAPEQTLFLNGEMRGTQTITSTSPLRKLFGLAPKVTTLDFSMQTGQSITRGLTDNPLTLISQEGGIEPSTDLRDVYKSSPLQGTGRTTLLTQSINTGLGQEYLGKSGQYVNFEMAGKSTPIVLIERDMNQALLTPEELQAGSPPVLKTSEYEGPRGAKTPIVEEKPATPLVDLGVQPSATEAQPPEPATATGTKGMITIFRQPAQTMMGLGVVPALSDIGYGGVAQQSQIGRIVGATIGVTLPKTKMAPIAITGLDPIIQGTFKSSNAMPTIVTNNTYVRTTSRLNSIPSFSQVFSNPFINQQSTASTQKVNQTPTQKTIAPQLTTQTTTQKVMQRTIPHRLNSAVVTMPAPSPIEDFAAIMPHFKLKNEQGRQLRRTARMPSFSYVSDFMHASLGIVGPRTKIGISRPIAPARSAKRRGRK